MNKLIPDLFETKLKLYQYNKLVIENYMNMIEIQNDIIIIDKYNIRGSNLKINYLNQFIVEIYGEIFEIVIK